MNQQFGTGQTGMVEMVKDADPYTTFFDWCDRNGFEDVGSGLVENMKRERFDQAMAAYIARFSVGDLVEATGKIWRKDGHSELKPGDRATVCSVWQTNPASPQIIGLERQVTVANTETQERAGATCVAPDGSAMETAFPGVWCCSARFECRWQGFALHHGLAWGTIPSEYDPWRLYHDRNCSGKLTQLVPPNAKGER